MLRFEEEFITWVTLNSLKQQYEAQILNKIGGMQARKHNWYNLAVKTDKKKLKR